MLGTILPNGHIVIGTNPTGQLVTVTRDSRQVHVYVDGVRVGERPAPFTRRGPKPKYLTCCECDAPRHAQGRCNIHYKRWMRVVRREQRNAGQGRVVAPGGVQTAQTANLAQAKEYAV